MPNWDSASLLPDMPLGPLQTECPFHVPVALDAISMPQVYIEPSLEEQYFTSFIDVIGRITHGSHHGRQSS